VQGFAYSGASRDRAITGMTKSMAEVKGSQGRVPNGKLVYAGLLKAAGPARRQIAYLKKADDK